eukprot:1907668-Rhodomonas_salina.2
MDSLAAGEVTCPILLRLCYAMSGTHVAYAPILPPRATGCAVLSYRLCVCAVLSYGTCGTDLAYRATGVPGAKRAKAPPEPRHRDHVTYPPTPRLPSLLRHVRYSHSVSIEPT